MLEVTESDKLGLMQTQARASRSNAKRKVKSSKQVQRYVFNALCKRTALYRDYFSPDSEAEKEMLGLKNAVRFPLLTAGFLSAVRN